MTDPTDTAGPDLPRAAWLHFIWLLGHELHQERYAHAVTRSQLDRAETGRTIALHETRATERDLADANRAAWQALQRHRRARRITAAALLTAVLTLAAAVLTHD